MSRMILLVSSALRASAFSTQVFAAEGKFDQQSCYAGPVHLIQHADGIMSGSYAVVGMTPGSASDPLEFRMLTGHCLGAFSIVNGQLDENGTCEYVNPAGDKYFGAYSRKGDPAKAEGTWRYLHGTGKFAGIIGDGHFMPIGPFPPAAENMTTACNHEWGTYKY